MATAAQADGNGGRKGQHFSQSAAARTGSSFDIAEMPKKKAYELFCKIRWAETQGEPYCPKCGCLVVYTHKKPDGKRPIYTCKACLKQFSATSGTAFHGRKMPIKKILFAIMEFTNGAKGFSALQMTRAIKCQYKSAYVLLHKLREALGLETDERIAEGIVEIDGAVFGGHIRPENYKEDRIDRRLAQNQTGKRRFVIVMRERKGRTMPFVERHEAHAIDKLKERIKLGSEVHADEAPSWNDLEYAGYDMKRINHQEAYSDGNACTNQAESFFSRLRRAEIGIHHHIAGPYLDNYAKEMAWREDARRISNGTQFKLIVQAGATSPQSKKWSGYWQRSFEKRKKKPVN